MTAPDHTTKPFENILHERGHPYMRGSKRSYPVKTVESRKGAVTRRDAFRFPSPLIKPDVRISRILCGAPHKMRNVVAVVMWRWAQKAPSQGHELIFERHITKCPRMVGLPIN